MALMAIFFVAPIVMYVQFGVIQLVPSIEVLLRIAVAVVFSSFLLTLITWFWGKLATKPEND